MKHPAAIVAEAQQAIVDSGNAETMAINIASVLENARRDLEAYFSHQPAPHVMAPAEADAKKAQMDIEKIVRSVLLGVMTRVAIFEALEKAMLAPNDSVISAQPVDYSAPYVDPYPYYDGEHQFMIAMVRELDAGLLTFYQGATATAYRLALRDALARFEEAEREYGAYPSRAVRWERAGTYDPWTCDAGEMFAADTHRVSERVRQTLRHNAETSMQFIRLVCPAILHGFEEIDREPPAMTMEDLQALALRELPTLLIPAGIRTPLQAPEDPQERQLNPLSHEALICEVREVSLHFRWASSRLSRPRKGGKCPANSTLTALSDQQQRVMNGIGVTHMSSAEALMRLALLKAPHMWAYQYDAQQLLRAPHLVSKHM